MGVMTVGAGSYRSGVQPEAGGSEREMAQEQQLRRPVEFATPPLIEVACGVQFKPIDGWSTAHYGLFWSTLKSEYPLCEDHPPLPRLSPGDRPELEFELTALPPLRRVYFIDQTGNFVIQLQPYRFLHNWRRIHETDVYPKFRAAFERFLHYWQKFTNFLRENGLSGPEVEICELTYLNHIYGPHWRFPRDLSKFLVVSDLTPISKAVAEPDGVALAFGSPLSQAPGRLDVTIRSGKRTADEVDVLVLELTARGQPVHLEDEEQMHRWYVQAHDAILLTFLSMTTEEAQVLWGRRS